MCGLSVGVCGWAGWKYRQPVLEPDLRRPRRTPLDPTTIDEAHLKPRAGSDPTRSGNSDQSPTLEDQISSKPWWRNPQGSSKIQ
jgi:hypothetical protein